MASCELSTQVVNKRERNLKKKPCEIKHFCFTRAQVNHACEFTLYAVVQSAQLENFRALIKQAKLAIFIRKRIEHTRACTGIDVSDITECSNITHANQIEFLLHVLLWPIEICIIYSNRTSHYEIECKKISIGYRFMAVSWINRFYWLDLVRLVNRFAYKSTSKRFIYWSNCVRLPIFGCHTLKRKCNQIKFTSIVSQTKSFLSVMPTSALLTSIGSFYGH